MRDGSEGGGAPAIGSGAMERGSKARMPRSALGAIAIGEAVRMSSATVFSVLETAVKHWVAQPAWPSIGAVPSHGDSPVLSDIWTPTGAAITQLIANDA